MTIEQHVYNTLRANAAVTALCPASRIKVPGNWQNLQTPYIVHFPVSLRPTQTHEGLASLRIWDYYQVGIYAATYSEGRALLEAVLSALDGWRGGVRYMAIGTTVWVTQDADVDVHHFVLNFQVAESLSTSPV